MVIEFDNIYAFKFTPSNYGHEKNRVINSFVFGSIHHVLTASAKIENPSTAKTGCGDRG